MKAATPSAFKAHWESRIKVIQCVLEGLDGKPFNWDTKGATKTYLRLARDMGVTLVTKNQIHKMLHILKRDVKPVGKVNFGGRFGEAHVYVLEVQTTESEKAMRTRHETGMTVHQRLMETARNEQTGYVCEGCGRPISKDEKLFGSEDSKCKMCRVVIKAKGGG